MRFAPTWTAASSDWLQPPPRRALEHAHRQGNQLPNPTAPPGQRENRREPEGSGGRAQESLGDIYRGIALEELRSSRRTGDRFALMRVAGSENKRYGAKHSVAFGVINEANAAAVVRAKAAHQAATRGRKRKSSHSLQDDMDEFKQGLPHIDTSGMQIDLDCDQVRGQINQVVEGGVMKKTEFCSAIGVSNAAVNAFLKKRGPFDGAKSDTFTKAWDWFKQREIAGLKLPNVNKRRQTEATRAAAGRPTHTGASAAAGSGSSAGTSTGPSAASTAATAHAPAASSPGGSGLAGPRPVPDISGVHLPGEETDAVPVHDTCDVVRDKIDGHLAAHKVTQAQFCREIYAHGLRSPTRCKGIQPRQLADFRRRDGSNAGATSSVFYAAYVYFEKLRLARNQPKSEHRLEMERRWPDGLDRKHDDRVP